MPYVPEKREYRQMPILTAGAEKRIDSECYVEGYATTFCDSYDLFEIDGIVYKERIEPDAMNGADMSDVIMQYDHSGRVLARMSNGTLIVEPNQRGLFVAADLSKSNAGRDMFNDINEQLVTKMSWAFTVGEDVFDKATHTRIIKRIKKVYDVSAVSMPANSSTDISARSFAEGRAEAERQELLELRKRKLLLSLTINV